MESVWGSRRSGRGIELLSIDAGSYPARNPYIQGLRAIIDYIFITIYNNRLFIYNCSFPLLAVIYSRLTDVPFPILCHIKINTLTYVPLVLYNMLMYTSTIVRLVSNVVRIIIFSAFILTYDHTAIDAFSLQLRTPFLKSVIQ